MIFQHVDVTKCQTTFGFYTRAMVPDTSLSGIVGSRLVTQQIKSKMTRECDARQNRFRPQRVRRCRQPARSIIGFQMLCATIPSELEAVEAHEVEPTMAHVKYNKALREAAREQWLRNKHLRCNVCVRTIENPMRNKALTPVLVLESRDNLCSNVTQFLQDITNVAAGSKT